MKTIYSFSFLSEVFFSFWSHLMPSALCSGRECGQLFDSPRFSVLLTSRATLSSVRCIVRSVMRLWFDSDASEP